MAVEQFAVPLFPTPLGVFNLGEVHQWHDERLVDAIGRAQNDDPVGSQGSNVGGWHSNNPVSYTHLTLPTKA